MGQRHRLNRPVCTLPNSRPHRNVTVAGVKWCIARSHLTPIRDSTQKYYPQARHTRFSRAWSEVSVEIVQCQNVCGLARTSRLAAPLHQLGEGNDDTCSARPTRMPRRLRSVGQSHLPSRSWWTTSVRGVGPGALGGGAMHCVDQVVIRTRT